MHSCLATRRHPSHSAVSPLHPRDTNYTALSLIPTITGNTFAASLRTDICPQRKESSSTSNARNPFNLNFFYSAQCLMVRRWRLIGHFPILYNPSTPVCGSALQRHADLSRGDAAAAAALPRRRAPPTLEGDPALLRVRALPVSRQFPQPANQPGQPPCFCAP
jgi:hypothetical protein